jgi:hypothetical protein
MSENGNQHRSVHSGPVARWPCSPPAASGALRTSSRDVPGVVDTEVGYTGGWVENTGLRRLRRFHEEVHR